MNINLILGLIITFILLCCYIGFKCSASNMLSTPQTGGMGGVENSIDVINAILYSP
jgi:hypothetical protein